MALPQLPQPGTDMGPETGQGWQQESGSQEWAGQERVPVSCVLYAPRCPLLSLGHQKMEAGSRKRPLCHAQPLRARGPPKAPGPQPQDSGRAGPVLAALPWCPSGLLIAKTRKWK